MNNIIGKRILVTGSDGFIGRHLVNRLSSDNIIYPFDLSLPDAYLPKSSEVDMVFHLAAMNGTRNFYKRPLFNLLNDTDINMQIIRQYAADDVYVLFTSSSEWYNGYDHLRSIQMDRENDFALQDITNPRHSYVLSKLHMEAMLHYARQEFGMRSGVARLFNIFGPGQKDHFMPEFVERCFKLDFSVPGANEYRSFMYVEDCVDVLIHAASQEVKDTFDVGDANPQNIGEVAKMIKDYIGFQHYNISPEPGFTGSCNFRSPNVNYIERQFGYQAKNSFSYNLHHTLDILVNGKV